MRRRRQVAIMNKLKHSGLGSTPLRGGVQTPAPISNREKEAWFSAPVGEGVYLPPGLGLGVGWDLGGMRGASDIQNSNRESLRLETLVTQRKESTGPTSNREKEALFSTARGAEKWAGLKARPYDGNGERNSNREKDPSPRKTPGEHEKHKIAPPIFVAIKNHPDPVFSWSYSRLLISPCSD
jgi:hypothetical protein